VSPRGASFIGRPNFENFLSLPGNSDVAIATTLADGNTI
jgi:hypothetical protein